MFPPRSFCKSNIVQVCGQLWVLGGGLQVLDGPSTCLALALNLCGFLSAPPDQTAGLKPRKQARAQIGGSTACSLLASKTDKKCGISFTWSRSSLLFEAYVVPPPTPVSRSIGLRGEAIDLFPSPPPSRNGC